MNKLFTKKVLLLFALACILLVGFVIYLVIQSKYYYTNKTKTKTNNQSLLSIDSNSQVNNIEDTKSIDLKAVNSISGNGEATRFFSDGFYMHTILANLPDPGNNFYYEAWLYKNNQDYFSLGQLNQNNGSYFVSHVSEVDWSSYPVIIITKETNRGYIDGIPETPILEGTF